MTTYFVTDQTTNETVTVTDENLAETVELFKERLRQKCVEHFPVIKIEQVDDNTQWLNTPGLVDTDEGVYAVFNFFTGTHEPAGTAAETLAKRAVLVEQYVNEAYAMPSILTDGATPRVEVMP